MIKIHVGKEENKQTFDVYEGLLKHYSTYFRTALKEEWAEGQSKTITLACDSPTVFRCFFTWLMIRKLYAQLDSAGRIPVDFDTICEAYVFGDARGIPEFCNASIDILFQKSYQIRSCDMSMQTLAMGVHCESSLSTTAAKRIIGPSPKI
jgi:hypothetical protein